VSESQPALLPLFRSGQQLRILGELYLHADDEYSLSQLVERTGVPQQTVSREIDRLVDAGLVSDRRLGRMRLVRADREGLYFDELSSMLRKALGPVPVLRTALTGIPGIDAAYIYGSWARRYQGQPGPEPQDIDVLVVGQVDVDRVTRACRRTEATLGRDVNPNIVSAKEWRTGRSGFLTEVRSGPLVPIIEPSP
jgi:DNA-binding transcriptional ArsR family regulator